MDCCCCGKDGEYLEGPEGVFHGCVEPESARYVLYVAGGCPFAARAWFVVKFYGLEESVQIVRTFPSNGEDSWFFKPVSEWEKTAVEGNPEAAIDEDPLFGVTHLRDIYAKRPEYKGKITVPVMYDKKAGEVISNDSMQLAKALCGKGMRAARTRNKDVELLPSEDDAEATAAHDALLEELHADWTTKVYKIHGSATQAEHEKLTDELFATLEKMEKQLVASSADDSKRFLLGGSFSLADSLLFHTALRFELAYRWRFNIGGDSIEGGPGGSKYPAVWGLVKRCLSVEGVTGPNGSVRPRDIMCTYWLSVPLLRMGSKKSPVPRLPPQYTLTGLSG